MEPRRRKLLARLTLGTGIVAALGWLAQLDYSRQLTTDVLELIPADERQPEVQLVRQLASQHQARAAWFVLQLPASSMTSEESATVLARTTAAFTTTLQSSPALAEVVALDDPALRDDIGGFIFRRRFDLLLPDWLAARTAEHAASGSDVNFTTWLAEKVAGTLEEFLAQPDALAFESALPADPLLLVPPLVTQMEGLPGADLASSPTDHALVWARLTESPLTEAGQRPVFAAVEQATLAARGVAPGLEVQWTAVNRFAAESRQRIEREMSVLNTAALLAVLLVAALCLRRVWNLLHLVPGVLCSLLGAWTITTLVYDRIHVLVFVIGSLLGGIASDYALHVYLHRGAPGEDFGARLRAVRRPLLGSAVTALIGFSALLFSDLPLIRQVGVFVLAGLVAAIGSAVLWFAQVAHPQGELRPRLQGRFPGTGHRSVHARRLVLLAGALVAAVGVPRVQWRDDIRDLDVHVPELWKNDRAVRAAFGETPDRSLFLARGDTAAAARTTLEQFAGWLREAHPAASLASIGFALPTPDHWQELPERLTRLTEFAPELRAALERHGFEAAAFAPFFADWETWLHRASWPAFADLVGDFQAALHGPAGMLFATEAGVSWFAVAVDRAEVTQPPTELTVVNASQLGSLNELFGRYRRSALRLSLFGLAAASLCVLLIYGVRRGPRMILVPLGACLVTFGLLGLAGQTLNLFHLLGAFLALCLSFDYAIFTGAHATHGAAGAPPSVRLSALNTTAAFGVLAFSDIAVVAALGVTVALIALLALILVELDLFQPRQ